MMVKPSPGCSRRFHDPVETMPAERSSVYGRHHLLWPAADINLIDLTGFRGLACTSARNLDSMVHTLIHQHLPASVDFETSSTPPIYTEELVSVSTVTI
jgi:hypothetical protein